MLFRREVLEAKKSALYGDVLIVTPMAFKVIAGFFGTIFVGVLLFISVTSFARIEKVPGAIVPSNGIIQVQSSSSGVLTELSVKDGQRVERGEVVGRIVREPAATDGDSERAAQLQANQAELRSLEARARHAEQLHELQNATNDRELHNLQAQLERKQTLRRTHERVLAESRAAFERAEFAFDRKLIRADQLTSDTLRMIEAETELQRLESEIESLRERIHLKRMQKEEVRSENQMTLLELEAERTSLLGEDTILRSKNAFDVLAPASGRVTAVLMSQGFDIQGSRPIFSILPEGSQLQAELYVPSRAIGFVETGQPVRLLFDAFPYERFGALSGTIESVTDTVILPEDKEFLTTGEQPIQEPVYRVMVSLSSTHFDADGVEVPIRNGMLIDANIILEERTILSWILQPVFAVLGRS